MAQATVVESSFEHFKGLQDVGRAFYVARIERGDGIGVSEAGESMKSRADEVITGHFLLAHYHCPCHCHRRNYD